MTSDDANLCLALWAGLCRMESRRSRTRCSAARLAASSFELRPVTDMSTTRRVLMLRAPNLLGAGSAKDNSSPEHGRLELHDRLKTSSSWPDTAYALESA